MLAGILLTGLAALVLVALLLRPTLDLTPFKGLVEARLSTVAGVPVTLRELYLEPSLQPRVEARGLRMARLYPDGVEELASAETTELRLRLLPLLERRISIGSLRLDSLTVQARPMIALAQMWFEEDQPRSLLRVDALEGLDVDRVLLLVTDADGGIHRLSLDQLDGGIARSSPLELRARGDFDDLALHFEVRGPTLGAALDPGATLPIAADLEIAGTRLSLDGAFTTHPSPPDLAFEFTLRGDDLTATFAAGGLAVPFLGPFSLQGHLAHSEGPIRLSALEGEVGGARLSGSLQLGFGNDRPALRGNLATDSIDLDPWLKAWRVEDAASAEKALPSESPFERPFPVETMAKALAFLDLDLDLAIGGLEGLPTTVDDVRAALLLEEGRMTLPFELQLAGIPAEGQVELACNSDLLAAAFDLSASSLPLGALLDSLERGPTSGTVGRVQLAASSSGKTVRDLLDRLAFQLDIGDAQLRFRSPDRDRQVDLVLAHMKVGQGLGTPVRAILDGDLRGHAYRIELTGQGTKDWRSEIPWLFSAKTEGLGGRLRLEGLLGLEPEGRFLALEFEIAGERIGDLEPWWGVPASADYSYEAHGHLSIDATHGELDLDGLRVGQTTARASVQMPHRSQAPILVDLASNTAYLDELIHLLGSTGSELASNPVLTVDIPVWTTRLTLPDTRLHVELERVLRSSPELADPFDVVADLEILDSRLKRAAFSARADDGLLEGELGLDGAAGSQNVSLKLGGEAIELGRLVPLEAIAPDLVVRVGRIDLQATAKQQTLQRILSDGIDLSGAARDLYLSTPSLTGENLLELILGRTEISGSPTQPLRVSADGLLGGWPVELELRLGNELRMVAVGDRTPFALSLRTADILLDTQGELTLPASTERLDLGFTLTADRLSSFEPFLGHPIPKVGPVVVAGDLSIRSDNYAVENLSAAVGESDLQGRVHLSRAGARPRLEAELASSRLHLAELLAERPHLDEVPRRAAHDSKSLRVPRKVAGSGSWLERLESTSPGGMDLDLNLLADEIYWGSETGGGGRIQVRREEGLFTLGPFALDLAGGSVVGKIALMARDGLVDADLELGVHQVEYGPLLRFLDPAAAGTGKLDLETRLRSSGEPAQQLPASLAGEFRFALFPREIDASVLDIWGAGLIRSTFRLFDPTNESALNCVVGGFSVADGLMTTETFWFDTSRFRVRGKGSVDLEDLTLKMLLRPRPKRRTFLSLATPAKIRGPLQKPSVSLSTTGIASTAFRIYMWWWTIYAQVLKKPLPRDGSDVCFLPLPPATGDPSTIESVAAPKPPD
jgi:uncharacterized protein involved in outer membrane biogenesis